MQTFMMKSIPSAWLVIQTPALSLQIPSESTGKPKQTNATSLNQFGLHCALLYIWCKILLFFYSLTIYIGIFMP
jgi:hypothetical protein